MLDLAAQLVIGIVNWLVGLLNGAWSVVAPPDGVVMHGMKYLHTLDAFLPISDLGVIVGLIGSMAAFTVILKFGVKLVDWLPKKA